MLPLIGLLCGVLSSVFAEQLTVVNQWNLFKYNTPSWYPKNSTFGSNPISSIEVDSDRIFLAVPREFAVTPATLVYVPKYAAKNAPLEAYPHWEWHIEAVADKPGELNCYGIINAFKLQIDKCGRLWVLDNGNLYGSIGSREVNVCPPKLIVFDLHTDQEVRRIEFPKEASTANSRFVSFVLDHSDEYGAEPAGNCDAGFIYLSNQKNPSIVVYNQQTTEYWVHSDPSFFPEPAHAKIEVLGGEPMIALRGINQLALLNSGYGSRRELFFSPLTSKSIYCVDTAALKADPNPGFLLELPVKKIAEKSSQSVAFASGPDGHSLIFGLYNETAVASLDLRTREQRILSSDPVALQGVLDIHSAILDDNAVWVVSSRTQRTFYNNINPHEINQRVMRFEKPAYTIKYVLEHQ